MRLLPVFLCALLTACANGSALVVGQTRPATTPESVKIYAEPPKQYERIAILNTEGVGTGQHQANQDLAIAELKNQAAKVGANGVLLTNINNHSQSGVYGGSRRTYASGEAIWVSE